MGFPIKVGVEVEAIGGRVLPEFFSKDGVTKGIFRSTQETSFASELFVVVAFEAGVARKGEVFFGGESDYVLEVFFLGEIASKLGFEGDTGKIKIFDVFPLLGGELGGEGDPFLRIFIVEVVEVFLVLRKEVFFFRVNLGNDLVEVFFKIGFIEGEEVVTLVGGQQTVVRAVDFASLGEDFFKFIGLGDYFLSILAGFYNLPIEKAGEGD